MKEILNKIKKNAIWLTSLWSVFVYLFLVLGIILLVMGFVVLPKSQTYAANSNISTIIGILGAVLVCLGIIGVICALFFFKNKIFNLVNQLEYFKQDFTALIRRFFLRPIQVSFELIRKSSLILKNYDDILKAAKLEEKNYQITDEPSSIEFVETERLKLRAFDEEKDLDIVYKYRNDPDCKKYQSFSAFTKKEIKQLFELNKNPSIFKNGDSLFAIAKNDDDTLVGELYTSKTNDEIYLGFTIAPENQRQGYAFEILSDLIVKIVLSIPESKIFCSIFPKNIKSINLVKKLGFEYVEKIDSNLGVVHIYQFKKLVEKNKSANKQQNQQEISMSESTNKRIINSNPKTNTKSISKKTTKSTQKK